MRVDAEGAHQLTEPYLLPDDHVDPAFAPDGRRIVFASGHTQGDLYTLDRASRGVQRITTDASARSPAYAPDGSRIVFVRRGSGSGTELATLTPTGEDLQLLPVGAGAEWVDWSWATGWIAFSYADSRGLALWDPQGQSSVRPGPSGCCPRFSPDGRQIAYLDGRGELRIWDLAGEATRGLGIRAASRPAWQPLTRPNAPPCDAARLPVRSLRLSATRWKRLAWKGLRDADGDRLSVDLRSAEPQSWNVQVAQFGRRSVAFRIRVGTRLRRARRIRLAYTVVDERGERCDETSTLLVR
jgi:WD40 repeat protein